MVTLLLVNNSRLKTTSDEYMEINLSILSGKLTQLPIRGYSKYNKLMNSVKIELRIVHTFWARVTLQVLIS